MIKASAGTLYRAPILVCPDLLEALEACRSEGMDVCTLEAEAPESLFGSVAARRAGLPVLPVNTR